MPRKHEGRCLHLRDWPELDQKLWQEALAARDYEDENRSPAAKWRPTTIQTNREGYGRWIDYLERSGKRLDEPPDDRVTRERVKGYLTELEQQGVSIRSRCNRISELLSVLLAIAPDGDWAWLKHRFKALDAQAQEARQRPAPPLLAGDILARAFKELRAMEGAEDCDRNLYWAIGYRNWLMLATLTLVPLRRRNFATLSLDQHMRVAGREWLVEIPAAEAKGGKPITKPIPPALHCHIRFYLEQVRPILLKGNRSDRLWITNRHGPMTPHSFFIMITNFTREVFGAPIGPHKFRHIGATSILLATPGETEVARAFLGHGDYATTHDHYVIGESIAASRQRSAVVAKLRRSLPGRRRSGETEQPSPEL
jgi:site-specific recombinase XerD